MLQCNKHPVRSLQIFNQFWFCFSWLDNFQLVCLMKHRFSRQPQSSVKQGRGAFSVCFLRKDSHTPVSDHPVLPMHRYMASKNKPVPPGPHARVTDGALCSTASTRSDQQGCYKLHIPYKKQVYRVSQDIQVPKWQLQNTRCICTRNKFSHKSAKFN